MNAIYDPPYNYVYTTFVKQRWLGRKYIDVLSIEFKDYDREYFQNALKIGQIQILRKDNFLHDPDLTIVDSDLVLHFVHRHETPIFGLPVIEQTSIVLPTGNNLQLCYKPAGIPVHPSSHYNKHSLTELVHFNPSNRLDRLVSGYLLGGSDPKDLRAISMLIQSHDKLLKMYIAETRIDLT